MAPILFSKVFLRRRLAFEGVVVDGRFEARHSWMEVLQRWLRMVSFLGSKQEVKRFLFEFKRFVLFYPLLSKSWIHKRISFL